MPTAKPPRPTAPNPLPIQYTPFTKDHFSTPEGIAFVNLQFSQIINALNRQTGQGGPVVLPSGIDVAGATVSGLGKPQKETDAVSLGHAQGNYGAPAVGPQLDIGGSNPLKGLANLYLQSYVNQILAGAGISISPASGTGKVRISATGGGGGIGGSGTTGFLPQFSAPTTLADSIIDYGATTPGGLNSSNTGAGGTVFADSGGGGIELLELAGAGLIIYTPGTCGFQGSNFSLSTTGGSGQIVIAGFLVPNTLYSAAGTPLPAANSVPQGSLAWVSDALAPTYNGAYISGGAVTTIVISDGATNWFTH